MKYLNEFSIIDSGIYLVNKFQLYFTIDVLGNRFIVIVDKLNSTFNLGLTVAQKNTLSTHLLSLDSSIHYKGFLNKLTKLEVVPRRNIILETNELIGIVFEYYNGKVKSYFTLNVFKVEDA